MQKPVLVTITVTILTKKVGLVMDNLMTEYYFRLCKAQGIDVSELLTNDELLDNTQ